MQTPLETNWADSSSDVELTKILATRDKQPQILSLQSRAIKVSGRQAIPVTQFVDMHRSIKDFSSSKADAERIKDFPYPRQYASINSFFINLSAFCFPSLLGNLNRLNHSARGHQGTWSGCHSLQCMISWMYTPWGESEKAPKAV